MEIKPQELRLGNIIQREVWGEGVVTKIGPDGFVTIQPKKLMGEISCTCIELSGIELTPEWLERFGFKIHSDYDYRNYILPHNNFMISMWLGEGNPAGFEEHGTCYWGDNFKVIKTVHRLQNLYFALTGEELAIDKQISNGN